MSLRTALVRCSHRHASPTAAACRFRTRIRFNSTIASQSVSQSEAESVKPSPSQHLRTLRSIDQLLTSIAESSTSPSHPSPLAMRTHKVPWLSSKTPDLPSPSPEDPSTSPSTKQQQVKGQTKAQEEEMLRPKHMSESFTSFELPLASDPKLFDLYVNTSGGFRMGKLLEHLDSLAGAVAYRHCLPAPKETHRQDEDATTAFHEASKKAGLYLATASADRLDMFGKLSRNNARDLRYSGFVTYTGKSSMEVVVKLQGSYPPITPFSPRSSSPSSSSSDSTSSPGPGGEEVFQHGGKEWETLMLGRFAMVCRDAKTHKARRVPKLIVESEEEKALWAMGEEHKLTKEKSRSIALDRVPPSFEEAKELHELMVNVVDHKVDTVDGEKVVMMKDTEIESVQLMFPQDRNLHGKVFGGILMRLAFELCFTNAAIFASTPLRFLSLDEITFRLPVPIGAVLRLSSKVVQTTKPNQGPNGEAKVHIMVRAEVEEVETGVRRETNTFYFTMAKEDHEPLGRTVVPSTYSEAMHYLEGKRRLEVGDEMRRNVVG